MIGTLPVISSSASADARAIADRVNNLIRRENNRRPIDGRLFGFKGDGSDESDRLQAALDAAESEKAEVIMPPGRFVLGSEVDVTGQMAMVGNDWGTVFIPASDSIGRMFNVTGSYTDFSNFMIDASAVASPTFEAFHFDSGGLNRLDDIWIYGAGTGLNIVGANANRISNMRIQQCPVGVQTGGTSGKFPGDTTWDEVVILPTAAGTGIIFDGNTNAQYMHRVQVAGGAKNLVLRGAGIGTGLPDGILFESGNMTASSGPVVTITKGRNVNFDAGTFIGGSTGGEGILIDAASASDVDLVNLDGTTVRSNAKEGLKWTGGSNVTAIGAKIHGNSQAAAGVYNNAYVRAGATGLCQFVGCMLGYSQAGEIFGNIAGPAKRGIELEAGALTNSGSYYGALMLVANVWRGNTVGTYLDNSAPAAADKVIGLNL